MFKKIKNFIKNSSGATAIEYALIAGLIAIAAIVVMRTLGGTIKNTYSTVNTALTTANAG